MLSRRAAYHGLLTCLVAILALGMQPQLAEKAVAEAGQPSPNVPAQEQQDDEESEEESEEEPGATPLRRKVLIWAHACGEAQFIPASVSAPASVSTSLPTRKAAELAARNGIGGPLRL